MAAQIPDKGATTTTTTAPDATATATATGGAAALSTSSISHGRDPVHTLVVDSAPLIKATPLAHLATRFITVPEVISEIRDVQARQRLANLPFTLETKVPSHDALQAIVAFSKKTGDFAALSAVDLRVLALAYMMEKEAKGIAHLRTELVAPRAPIKRKKRKAKKQVNQEVTEEQKVATHEHRVEKHGEVVEGTEDTVGNEEKEFTEQSNGRNDQNRDANDEEESEGDEEEIDNEQDGEGDQEDSDEEVEVEVVRDDHNDYSAVDYSQQSTTPSSPGDEESQEEQNDEEEEEEEEEQHQHQEEDSDQGEWITPVSRSRARRPSLPDLGDEDGWITPTNIAAKKAALPGGSGLGIGSKGLNSKERRRQQRLGKNQQQQTETIPVATITADFAMQNVLLQIGLRLLSVDGVAITSVKSFVLRCHACFKVTKDMEKTFCPSCGNNTLIKTTVGVDADGNVKYFLKKNFQYNNRGTKYSIKEAKGGRRTTDLLLREDQREYQRAVTYQKRAKQTTTEDAFDADYVPLDSRKAPAGIFGGMPLIGHGRKNVNMAKKTRQKRR